MTTARRVRSGSHRRLRGRVWWYRRDVPKDVRDALGCTAVWKSLGTCDENEAKRLEKAEDVEFEQRLRGARDCADPAKRQMHAAAAYLSSTRQLGVGVREGGQTGGIGLTGYLNDTVGPEDHQAVGDMVLAAMHQRARDQSKIASLMRELAVILPNLPPESWDRCQTDLLSVVRHHVSSAEERQRIEIPQVCFWGPIFDSWQAEMNPGSKTVYSWKNIIRKLVAHLSNRPELTVDEAMAWNAASFTEEELVAWKNCLVTQIGSTTIKNHLTLLRTLYNYAANNRMLAVSVAEGVKRVRHKAKKRPGTRRLGYTDNEARAILIASRQEIDPVLRWSPWLAAALGARIDEICGAMAADIETDAEGITWFSVRLDHRDNDPQQSPELKSDNAERKIPLHPALLDEGFLGYVNGLPRDGPLFPTLKPDMFGRRGGNGSKRVQRWVRHKVKITDKRRAPSHSWRHRFRSIIRNPKYGISEDVGDYMSGQGGKGGEGRNYGEYRDAMVEAICRLPSPLPGPEHKYNSDVSTG